MLSRRSLLVGSAAAVAAPAIALDDAKRVLRFVPRTDLGVIDPVWSSANVTRNHGFMIYDTLFGMDASFRPSVQMLAGCTVEDGDLTWRLVLRDGLSWHDGDRVLARDCVASIRRWGARDSYGQALLSATAELTAADDKTIVFRLRKPFPFLPNALGKSGAYVPVMMPERLAGPAGSGKAVTEMVGSGPFRFRKDEHVPGARIVYERFAGYRPREDGVPSRTAGPKRVFFDRVEWITMPDGGTASAALQSGEVDWWDFPIVDLLPVLSKRPDLTLRINDPNGQYNVLRLNHLQPPFDNPAIRRALFSAVNQEDFMLAVSGDDRALWQDGVGMFCPGTPLASDRGLGPRGPRDLAAAKDAVAAAGYGGQPVVLLVATDFPVLRTLADVGADLMTKIGLKVDYQALDWGMVQQRRVKKDPVDRGGWSAFFTSFDGSDVVDPAGHIALRGNGSDAWFGWPTDPLIEELRTVWFSTPDLAGQKKIAEEVQREALANVPYVPVGLSYQPTAFRSNLRYQIEGFPIFWNVQRA